MSGKRTKIIRRALHARLQRAPTRREFRQAKRSWQARHLVVRIDHDERFKQQLRKWLTDNFLEAPTQEF